MSRSIRSIFFTLLLSVTVAKSDAKAFTLFTDDFNTENGGVGELNYVDFANWTVSDGAVDLIGPGLFDFIPGNGFYVDMDGSTGDAGKMTSTAFNFLPGVLYTLSFELAGNHRNGSPESVAVNLALGSLVNDTISLTQLDPFTVFSYNFSVLAPTLASISFEGAGGDNIGMLLDDVQITGVHSEVPEPATLLLLGSSLLGAARLRRHKRG